MVRKVIRRSLYSLNKHSGQHTDLIDRFLLSCRTTETSKVQNRARPVSLMYAGIKTLRSSGTVLENIYEEVQTVAFIMSAVQLRMEENCLHSGSWVLYTGRYSCPKLIPKGVSRLHGAKTNKQCFQAWVLSVLESMR